MELLEAIEKALVPDWDVRTRQNIVIGYHLAMGDELTITERSNEEEIKEEYKEIRYRLLQEGKHREWVGCIVAFAAV